MKVNFYWEKGRVSGNPELAIAADGKGVQWWENLSPQKRRKIGLNMHFAFFGGVQEKGRGTAKYSYKITESDTKGEVVMCGGWMKHQLPSDYYKDLGRIQFAVHYPDGFNPRKVRTQIIEERRMRNRERITEKK